MATKSTYIMGVQFSYVYMSIAWQTAYSELLLCVYYQLTTTLTQDHNTINESVTGWPISGSCLLNSCLPGTCMSGCQANWCNMYGCCLLYYLMCAYMYLYTIFNYLRCSFTLLIVGGKVCEEPRALILHWLINWLTQHQSF